MDAFPPTEELLVQLLERHHAWAEAHMRALMGVKQGGKIPVPAPPMFLRPDEEDEPKRHVETDPRVIARFFREHLGDEAVQS
jgi:hypothetical protein